MKTFEELRQSAQVLTREQMRMIVGGNKLKCHIRCVDGSEAEGEVDDNTNFDKLSVDIGILVDKKCPGENKGSTAICS